jgi:hypothetical protein
VTDVSHGKTIDDPRETFFITLFKKIQILLTKSLLITFDICQPRKGKRVSTHPRIALRLPWRGGSTFPPPPDPPKATKGHPPKATCVDSHFDESSLFCSLSFLLHGEIGP